MEKKVKICDVCNKEISQRICEICDKDVCETCEADVFIGIAEGGILFQIICCRTCSSKLKNAKIKSIFDDPANKEMRRNILKTLKNASVLESLEKEESGKEKQIRNLWNNYSKRKSFLSKFKIGGQAKK